jgi:phosphonate transport system substrate-binding protein
MKLITQLHATSRVLRLALMLLIAASAANATAQNAGTKGAPPSGPNDPRITLAVNEGGAANADYLETIQRYEEFALMIGKTLKVHVAIVAVRNRDRLQENLKKQAYHFLLARPNDVPAQAVRDWGYQVVATSKDPSQCWLVVPKNSKLKTIKDVKGASIVTPDKYSNMWRVANAMLRDSNIDMSKENVKSMRDQAAIAWSLESGFYDVGVINSVSGVARNWEKNGGRVIAKSRDLPNMPFIASPSMSSEQVARVRAAVLSLDSSEQGRAMLKKMGMNGFQDTSPKVLIDFLAWIGDLDIKQP